MSDFLSVGNCVFHKSDIITCRISPNNAKIIQIDLKNKFFKINFTHNNAADALNNFKLIIDNLVFNEKVR